MALMFKSLGDPALVKSLNDGSVGAIRTDTVYGLVCIASKPAAVERLYKLKSRTNKPGTIIAANLDQLSDLGIRRSYVKAVEQFWPGAVSVVVPYSDPNGLYLRQGKPDIAVRLPDDKALISLLSKTGALLTTSANWPGQETTEDIDSIKKVFGDKVDFYVDGGELKGPASTVIKIIDDAVEVLREGTVIIKNNSVA